MKTQYNEETHTNEWVLNKWYQKLALVCGYISMFCFVIGFITGFVQGLN